MFNNDFNGTATTPSPSAAMAISRSTGKPFKSRFERHLLVSGTLRNYGFKSATDMLRTYGGRNADLAEWLQALKSITIAISACNTSPARI